jgi:hypothetical protein
MNSNRLRDIPRDECLRLIAHQPVGRVVYTDGALPVCTPVNFAVHQKALVFRTAPASRMALALDGAVVAFEVDRFDEDGQSGWSVLVTGTATRVTDVSTLVRLEQLRLSPAAGEDRSCWMRIVPAMVTGRRVPTLGEVAAVTDSRELAPLAG